MATNITIRKFDFNTVLSLAVQFFNCKHYDKTGYAVNRQSAKHMLDRLCVNYIRHNLTNYESLMGSRTTKVQVLLEIAKTYPMLKEECYRQVNTIKF